MAETETGTGEVCSRSKNCSFKKRKSKNIDHAESRSLRRSVKSSVEDDGVFDRSLRLSMESSVEDDDVTSCRIESPVRHPLCNGKTYPDEYAIAPNGQRRAPLVPLSYGSSCFPDKTFDCVMFALSSFNEKNKALQGPEYVLVYYLSGCVRHPKPRIYHFNFIARAKKTTEADKPNGELFFAEVKYALREDGKVGPCLRCCCILGPWDIRLGGCKLLCKTRRGFVQHPKDGFTKCP